MSLWTQRADAQVQEIPAEKRGHGFYAVRVLTLTEFGRWADTNGIGDPPPVDTIVRYREHLRSVMLMPATKRTARLSAAVFLLNQHGGRFEIIPERRDEQPHAQPLGQQRYAPVGGPAAGPAQIVPTGPAAPVAQAAPVAPVVQLGAAAPAVSTAPVAQAAPAVSVVDTTSNTPPAGPQQTMSTPETSAPAPEAAPRALELPPETPSNRRVPASAQGAPRLLIPNGFKLRLYRVDTTTGQLIHKGDFPPHAVPPDAAVFFTTRIVPTFGPRPGEPPVTYEYCLFHPTRGEAPSRETWIAEAPAVALGGDPLGAWSMATPPAAPTQQNGDTTASALIENLNAQLERLRAELSTAQGSNARPADDARLAELRGALSSLTTQVATLASRVLEPVHPAPVAVMPGRSSLEERLLERVLEHPAAPAAPAPREPSEIEKLGLELVRRMALGENRPAAPDPVLIEMKAQIDRLARDNEDLRRQEAERRHKEEITNLRGAIDALREEMGNRSPTKLVSELNAMTTQLQSAGLIPRAGSSWTPTDFTAALDAASSSIVKIAMMAKSATATPNAAAAAGAPANGAAQGQNQGGGIDLTTVPLGLQNAVMSTFGATDVEEARTRWVRLLDEMNKSEEGRMLAMWLNNRLLETNDAVVDVLYEAAHLLGRPAWGAPPSRLLPIAEGFVLLRRERREAAMREKVSRAVPPTTAPVEPGTGVASEPTPTSTVGAALDNLAPTESLSAEPAASAPAEPDAPPPATESAPAAPAGPVGPVLPDPAAIAALPPPSFVVQGAA